MTDMFGDAADLSGIAPGNKLAVSEVRAESLLFLISEIFLYSIHISHHTAYNLP